MFVLLSHVFIRVFKFKGVINNDLGSAVRILEAVALLLVLLFLQQQLMMMMMIKTRTTLRLS